MPSSDSPVRTPEPLEPRDVRVDGIGVSSGASVGRVLRLDQRDIASGLPADVDADDPAEEIERLKLAVSRARKQVLALKERVATELGRGHAYFFEAHLLMLDDSELLADVERVIRTRRVKAEWAVKAVLDRIIRDARDLKALGIACVAISSNDAATYPEDSRSVTATGIVCPA